MDVTGWKKPQEFRNPFKRNVLLRLDKIIDLLETEVKV